MNTSLYYRKSKARIITALKNNPSTFEEICRKSCGLYPTTVRDIITHLKLNSKLVPLYTSDMPVLDYEINDDCYYEENTLITAQIQNNPVLSAWYFSWNTCSRLAQIDQWKDKRILFLGTPRLFEFFLTRKFGSHLKLIDLDKKVISVFEDKYKKNFVNPHFDFFCTDLLDFNIIEFQKEDFEKYDFIFFDPPWYLEHYLKWLSIAIQVVKPEGTIAFALFPTLLRPDAITERKKLLDICREISRNTFVCPDILEYDVPSFEKRELEEEGIYLNGNWKTADIVILNGVLCEKSLVSGTINEPYSNWIEFDWLNTRWFLNITKQLPRSNKLLTVAGKSRFLTSPSRRNEQLEKVNLLSSKGHGLCVSDTELFQIVLKNIQDFQKSCSYHDAILKLNLDDESKKIFLKLEEDC